MKNLSVRSYLILSHSLLVAISLVAVGILWSRNEYRIITNELKSIVLERATLIASVASHELAEEGKIQIDAFTVSQNVDSQSLLVVYINHSGVVSDLTNGKIGPEKVAEIQKLYSGVGASDYSYVELVNVDAETPHVFAGSPVIGADGNALGMICVLYPLNRVEIYISRQRVMLFTSILLIAILGIILSILLASYMSRYFSDAQHLAGMVSEGSYHLRLQETGPSELRDLSRYLNRMAAKLEEQSSIRRRLLSNLTHELARMLAGLQLGIESLRKGALRDLDLADDMLVNMGKAVNSLESLVEDIALAAKPEAHPITLNRIAVAVEPFLKGVAARFWGMAESRGIHLEVNVDKGLPPVDADEKRLNQILGNLVDNAIKFTPRDGTVYLSAELANEHSLRLVVRDCGPGLSREDAPHLFEPFFQGESGRRIMQGMGLGLAIAHQLALAHGGSLTLENHPSGGSVAGLILPAASA